MPLAEGSRVGPYEIVSILGAGGMGEVYRARDSRLNRDVAVKVVRPAVINDVDRVARFHREAQLLAALNHPNVAQIHGVEDADGHRAIVMELVEGPTLADRLHAGPLPLDEALPIARQIVEALEAAHATGIIHRDLKPGNIKVRADGTVKVLDFGLAKALEPDGVTGAGSTSSPTISMHATAAGIILGTAAYMSPEQARGRPVDKRADVWAFGAVFYEMLTGRRAFDAEDTSDTLALVLTKEPDWAALPASTPAAIRRLLRRCLARDPKRRLPDIAVARLEIDEALAPAGGLRHRGREMPVCRAPRGVGCTGRRRRRAGHGCGRGHGVGGGPSHIDIAASRAIRHQPAGRAADRHQLQRPRPRAVSRRHAPRLHRGRGVAAHGPRVRSPRRVASGGHH